MPEVKLLPCPFCGKDAKVTKCAERTHIACPYDGKSRWEHEAFVCNKSKAAAIRRWNRRTP